jgi:hypothetical protein
MEQTSSKEIKNRTCGCSVSIGKSYLQNVQRRLDAGNGFLEVDGHIAIHQVLPRKTIPAVISVQPDDTVVCRKNA